MLQGFRRTMRRWTGSRWMLPALGVASFLESIVIPVPLEAVLIPLMQARRSRLWWLATMALAGCIVGAVVGYYVGYFFMETAGNWLVERVGARDQFDRGRDLMDRHGFWFILGVSVMPVPFQIAMLAAGATRYPVGWYLLATLLSRGLRYFGLAVLVYYLGDQAEAFIKRHKIKAIIGACLLIFTIWAVTTWQGGQ